MAIILGIDASQQISSCALSVNTKLFFGTCEKPIENLMTTIASVLAQAKIDFNDIDDIVACIGPGSNMGTRTTVVTGNALALSIGATISGIISTDAMAVSSSIHGLQNVAVPAGRGRWYVATYDKDEKFLRRISYPALMDNVPDSLPSIILDQRNDENKQILSRGLLDVYDKQKHLISQLNVCEVVPFDRGGFDARQLD